MYCKSPNLIDCLLMVYFKSVVGSFVMVYCKSVNLIGSFIVIYSKSVNLTRSLNMINSFGHEHVRIVLEIENCSLIFCPT